jgi:sec-independent protein translocase protein TatA
VVGDILQPTHLLFILVIALLVLGPKRLPEVGKSLGRGLRDFRTAVSGDSDDDDDRPGGFLNQMTAEAPPAAANAAAEAAPVAPAPPEPVAVAAAASSTPVETGQSADATS